MATFAFHFQIISMALRQALIVICIGPFFGFLLMMGCVEERFETSPDVQLAFSVDTLRFDTVFTELGSATRSFRVYNHARLPVKISSVYFEAGAGSQFRVNVDGLTSGLNDIEIRGNDSIWVFVEVTVNPDLPLSESPFIIDDQLVFETNGNVQKISMEAWGQNANYIPNRFNRNRFSILSCDLGDVTWDDPKPYVIYGTLFIDSCTLNIPPGAEIYFHGGFANNTLGVYNDGLLFTLPAGRINVEGTVGEPVLIRDDRLEEDYSGLWNGIRLGPGSGPHVFRNAEIRLAATALSADSAVSLEMENVRIHSTAGIGFFARQANVRAQNCLFYNIGTQSIALTYGGDYQFDYCTVTSFGNDAEALIMNNFSCADPLCLGTVRIAPLNALFRNSIIIGSASDEIVLSDASEMPDAFFHYRFEHCIVRVDALTEPDNHPEFLTYCDPCFEWTFQDTLFRDRDMFDFHLDTLSIAEEKAIPINAIPSDLDGNMRDSEKPDIGCYEYVAE